MRKYVCVFRVSLGVLGLFLTGTNYLFSVVRLDDALPSDYVLEEVYRTIGLDSKRNTTMKPFSEIALPLAAVIDANGFNSSPNPRGCFPFNSQGWLESETRLKTIEEEFLHDVFQSFIGKNTSGGNKPLFQPTLDQTICIDGSPFREGWQVTGEQNSSAIRFWTARLVYLAIAYHQHRPAFDEYQHRQATQSSCMDAREKYKLTNNDYECPTAKFLVYPLKEFGLGVNMKHGALLALRIAIATDRMLLLVNNLKEVRSLRRPWPLVSCPRKDFQCFFLPPSPCTPTREEVQRAPYFAGKQTDAIYSRGGNFSNFMQHERILIYPANHPMKEPLSFRQRLVDICHELISRSIVPDKAIIYKAMERLFERSSTDPFKETEADYEIAGGILAYLMRPRPRFLQELQKIQYSLSSQLKAEAYPTMGLPIRGEYSVLETR